MVEYEVVELEVVVYKGCCIQELLSPRLLNLQFTAREIPPSPVCGQSVSFAFQGSAM